MQRGVRVRPFPLFTGAFAVVILGSAAFYVFDHAAAVDAFTRLGFPTWLIRPLTVAKVLGIAAITTDVIPALRPLAYAGFLYHLLLAVGAHVAIGEPPTLALIALALLVGAVHYDDR